MVADKTNVESGAYEVRPWEFNLLLLELIGFAGVALGWLWSLGPPQLGLDPRWADTAWKALGFLLLGLALYPALRIEGRHSGQHELRFGRWLLAALAGAAVGALVYVLMG